VPIIPICYFLSVSGMNMLLYVFLAVVLSVIVYFGILILLKNPLIFEGINKFKEIMTRRKIK
ncbi:MAG: hypothetical protein ACI4KG_00920, partial [Oscillospiraceae bacterium]